ncbi:MAG: L-2-hydroxyglutarate oxidase [Bacteroidetes bacterium]|nr:L-2-hydroxyglutarate oxidase [Bacteroidota bacterium]MDE2672792.1 L-2-hydroxyglutarate oxidase [Bacteroidota bacterium]
MECDVAIIGGGIVGLAAAWQLGRRYDCRVLVLEKESSVATHQSGRNSGVLHSGIYYQPRSKQAQTCLRGRRLMEEFCRTNDLPFELCGKVIIGSSPRELARLYTLYEWGRANDVQCQIIDRDALLEREPYSAGSKALLVRDAGIVDYPGVVRCLMSLAQEQGTDVLTNSYVHRAHEESQHIILETDNLTVHARHVLNCAGLYADRVAKLLGQEPDVRVLPFRGEYYELLPRQYCRHLIYPAGDDRVPFLGVHATRMTDGRVLCGPSAVLALSREGYTRCTVAPGDILDTVLWPGSWHLARSLWRTGTQEIMQSLSKRYYLRVLQRLIPAVELSNLRPARSGVRAQAVRVDGTMIRSMYVQESRRALSVLNASSPSATASLAIGETLARDLINRLRSD